MKKLIVGMGIIICGLIILCTDYIVKNVVGAMPGVQLIEGAAVFSLSIIGRFLIGIGIIIVILGYRKE